MNTPHINISKTAVFVLSSFFSPKEAKIAKYSIIIATITISITGLKTKLFNLSCILLSVKLSLLLLLLYEYEGNPIVEFILTFIIL